MMMRWRIGTARTLVWRGHQGLHLFFIQVCPARVIELIVRLLHNERRQHSLQRRSTT